MELRVITDALAPTQSHDEYLLHRAALEWSLAEPIIIQSAEDIKSRVDWKDRVEPFVHQVQNLMTFCRRLPVTLLADDVGLGKTISAGLIVSELMKRGKVSKTLVVCPKLLLEQWVEELDAKFGIPAHIAIGGALDAGAHRRSEPVIVTTYHSATRLLEQREPDAFDMLILDEAHKVRNLHGSQKAPKMATAVFSALEDRLFSYVLMLTATPIQNRLWDIYSLVDCLAVAKGHKNPFGTPNEFVSRFVADGKTSARRLKSEHTHEFRRIVGDYMSRTRRSDAKLIFPERRVKTHTIAPGPQELSLQRLVAEDVGGLNGLLQTSLLVAMMSSPQALAAQMESMRESGTISAFTAAEAISIAQAVAVPAKARAVLQIAQHLKERNQHWRMVVFTTRKETQRMLGDVLKDEGMRYGFITGGGGTRNQKTIEAFRQDPPEINVVVSTDAGAEGVNLQAANVLVNYDLPWNPMIVEQRIGRIQRIGSAFKRVHVLNVVHANSAEEKIVARLVEKLQIIAHTVGDIEAVLEASGDSEGESLERQIREMVISSLQGQDPEESARAVEENIEDAKRLIEDSQKEMERHLGDLQEAATPDVPMPRLERAEPFMPLKQFVFDALRSEGAEIEDRGDGLYSARSERLGEERFTFDARVLEEWRHTGVFMGREPLLYQPGKPAFERLVQRWIDRSAAHIRDQRCEHQRIGKLVDEWLATVPGASLVKTEIGKHRLSFSGNFLCRARVANAVDSYEKLIPVKYSTNGHLPKGNCPPNSPVETQSLAPDVIARVRTSVMNDGDIRSFREFYERRLRRELERSDSGSREKKLVNDLEAGATAEVSGVDGTLCSVVQVVVEYAFDGSTQYRSSLEIGSEGVVSEPPREQCALTKQLLPKYCLKACYISGDYVLKELLDTCAVTGKAVLPKFLVACEVTGRRMLPDATGVCEISGKRACRDQLVASTMSGRLGLSEHIRNCEFTGEAMLEDELSQSDISGKWFRHDEAVTLSDGSSCAHPSEAVHCDFSNKWYAEADCETSDLTGQPVPQDRVAYSEHSKRKCDLSELETCEATGMKLLPDEVDGCSVTGQQMHKNLLLTCPETGLQAHKDFFETCHVTKDPVLPEGLGLCEITSTTARRSLLGKSDVSGKTCLKERLVICERSGRRLLPEETETCQATGQRVDSSLLQECDETGDRVLPEMLERCSVSGSVVRKNLLRECPETGKTALETSFRQCDKTGDLILTEGIGECAVTGKKVRKSLLGTSTASGTTCLRERLVTCEHSDAMLLPEETDLCQATGKRVDARLLQECQETGDQVLPEELGVCSVSGKSVRKHLLHKCPETGAVALEVNLVECETTGDLAVPDAIGECCLTGKRVRNSLLGKSDVSGKKCLRGELVICEASGVRLLPGEVEACLRTNKKVDATLLGECDETGMRMLTQFLGRCSVSGRTVCTDLLRTCPETGKEAMDSHFEACQVSNIGVLPEGLATCCITGMRARRSLCGTSDASGKEGLLDKMVVCEVSSARLLPEETGHCQLTGKRVDKRLLKTCVVSGVIAHHSEMVQSQFTEAWMLPQHATKVADGRIIGKTEAARCAWSGKHFLKNTMAVCRLSGLWFSKKELNASGELSLLRDCLDGKWKGNPFPEVTFLARLYPHLFPDVKSLRWVSSETGTIHVLFGKMGLFRATYFAVLATGDLSGLTLVGNTVFGNRKKGVWHLAKEHSFQANES